MTTLTELLVAASDYLDAQMAFDRASAAYEGHSPGYHLRDEQTRWDKAKGELERVLNDYIDARVAAALKRGES